jgi:hypothetical protein
MSMVCPQGGGAWLAQSGAMWDGVDAVGSASEVALAPGVIRDFIWTSFSNSMCRCANAATYEPITLSAARRDSVWGYRHDW